MSAILCKFSLFLRDIKSPVVIKSDILCKFLLNLDDVRGKLRSCR